MAENGEEGSRDDLSDEASPHRAEEYRQKGQVSQSRDLTAFAAFTAAVIATYAVAPKVGNELLQFMREMFRTDWTAKLDFTATSVLKTHLTHVLRLVLSAAIPICGAGFVVGALASFAQVGAVFSVDPLTPDFAKVDPLQGFFRLFSRKQALDSARLILKMVIILGATYFLVKAEVLVAPEHMYRDTLGLIVSYAKVSKSIFITLFVIMGTFAIIDFAVQRFDYNKKLRMTKQEAKTENREREGDPLVRARVRNVQREMARKRMMQAVKTADVIVTNPTHIAVALVYDKTTMGAPRVVAKGADLMAQRIKQVGADAGVVLVENVPLARSLFKSVKVGHAIPKALYQAVAEVLAYVYKLRNRNL